MKSKKEKWDGRSRPVTDLYKKNFDIIFGKKEEDELKESYKQSLLNKKEREENEEYLKELKDKLWSRIMD